MKDLYEGLFSYATIMTMIHIEDSIVLDDLLAHIGEQRSRAKLVDQPFDLGIVTDKRPSQILELVENNKALLHEIGMSNLAWHDDALRSTVKLGGEELFISVCRPR